MQQMHAGGSPECNAVSSVSPALDASASLGGFLTASSVAMHASGQTVAVALNPAGYPPAVFPGMYGQLSQHTSGFA